MDRDPTPGDPDEVRELADELGEFADDVGEALGKIRGMAGERAMLEWAGLSADAFRREFDGVPDNLTKLEDSYSLCSQALHTYWPKLQTAQGMADRALDRAITAQADLASAQTALGDATDWVGRAGDEAERLQREGERDNVEPPDEADVRAATRDQQAAEAAAGAAQNRVNDAQERLTAARQLALDAQEMREEAARQCARDIDEASDAGIQNRRWWEKAIKWVTDNWDTLVEICKVIVAVLGVVVMIIGGPLAWVVLAAALVVLADTLIKYARGEAGLLDVAFAALDCIPGMKGLTTLGGLARGLRGAASTGLRGLRQGALGLGRRTRGDGVPMNGRNACGDPVDVATGELLMSATDVELPGILPLVIERHHISSYRAGRWFGTSWASTLDQHLLLDEHGARFFTADGMTLLYPRPLPDEPVLPVEGPRWTLTWNGQPEAPMAIHQRETGRTLHFAPTPGRPGSELPLIAITDRNNNRIQVAYDRSGAPTDLHHSGGYHLGITTDHGRVTALRLLNDPDQPTLLSFGYDQAGLLAEITNSSGLPLKFSYDEHFRMSRWEDRNGYWYSYDYDAEGRCVYTTGTDRALEYRYAYDPENHRTVVTNSLGHDTVYQFNDSYQLTAETNPLGHTTTHTWDRYDHTLTTTNPLGHTTRYEYDEHGNVTAVVRPDGREIRAEYNEFGQTTELVHADGSVWRQAYDTAGNRVALLDPAGRRTRYTFDDHGGLASVVDAAGNINRIHCDAAGLPRSLTNAMERATRYDRDAFGRLTRVTDPLGATSHTEYTTEGKPLRRSDPLNGVQTWAWDAEGNCLSHTDENGGTTHFEYGVFDQLKVQTDPDGARYEFIHDTELNVIRVANPQGHTWDYTYDAAGRLIAESDFDNRSVTYALDANGELLERTNALGQSVRFRHDVCGNLITKASASETSTFAYDPLGRLVRASNTHAEVVIERDPGGHIVSESINGLNVTYSRDRLGRMRTRTTPSGHTSTWDYNASGMPTSLKTADQNLVFSYDAADREIARALPSGISLNHTWDPSGRMANQVVTSENRVILRRAFTYRPDHYLTGVTDTTDSITRYSLDAVGRITAVTTPVATERYVYDAAGNQLVSPQGEHDYDGSRVAQAGATRFSYDGAGRTVLRVKTRISRKPDTWQYTWDEEDRLTAVRTPDGAIWRYRYDPLGRRIEKEQLNEQGERTARVSFAWSGTELVEQSGTHGCSDRETVLTWDYLGQRPVTQSETSTERESDKRFYAIVTDLIGTPTELVDTTGNVAWRSQNCVLGTDFQYARGEAANTPLRFPGQYADPESGWHYNFLRHYDPETARYTSPDPLGLGPAPNHYAYVHNPHTWTDPLGLAAHPARPRRQPEQVTETYADINQARNRALELLGDINPHTRQPYVGRLESAATHGQVVGFETVVDGTWKRFRMDYDPGKGPHFNVEIGRGAEGQR